MSQQRNEYGEVIEEDAPYVVDAGPGTRLADLHAAYADAKAAADEAATRLKVITDGIKSELSQHAPEQTRLELKGPNGPSLRMTYAESWRLDSKRLKKTHPEIWVQYAKKIGSWSLRVGGGEQ